MHKTNYTHCVIVYTDHDIKPIVGFYVDTFEGCIRFMINPLPYFNRGYMGLNTAQRMIAPYFKFELVYWNKEAQIAYR